MAPDMLSRLLAGYSPLTGVADELKRPDGSLRPVWEPLMRYLSEQSAETLARAFARGDQYLHDTGVYFRQYTGTGSTLRDWPLSHVPVVIGETEWAGLADGIAQRAELLERVMADLYGPGNLVRDGFLPADLVAQNPEWLRPVVNIRPRSGKFLHFLAFEIGRSPDGSWFVLGDRTQAPSGAGFSLENRMASSRVFHDLFPKANVERLAGFFRSFRDAMNGLRDDPEGRVAILTPGQHTDTYYEHAYIARYLGFSLLECEDLKVQDGKLSVRTINGPEPVSVLWRRLDSRFADPLELDETSALGTPGMVSALRAGAMDMVNCLGSGVLEARALMAFLPRICEHLMGAPLRLPNIATWWCGQPNERAYVLNNLERMMIGPAQSTKLPFDIDATTALGGKFRGTAHTSVAEWIEREGASLVGQEAVTLSTTPAMIDGKLVPRPMVVRVFAARTPEGWAVMPGGYARIGRSGDPTALAMQAGGSVADVWVMADQPVAPDTLRKTPAGPFLRRLPGLLPARAADNLYWLGRYVERAEGGVRVLRAYHLRLEEYGRRTVPLVDSLGQFLDNFGLDPEEPIPGALLGQFDAAVTCASKVRDRFSTDGWNALNDLSATAHDLATRVQHGDDAARAMGVLLRKTAGFSGLVHDNMFRFLGWRFLTLGRALERADQIAAVLAAFAGPEVPAGGFDAAVEIGDSVMTHRRRYTVETNRDTVIDLLALDRDNPRSMLFQLDRLREEETRLAGLAGMPQLGEASRHILRLQTALAVATPEETTTERLGELRAELAAISEALTAQYLS
ncbi:circularly permuted type 2 ATP-grasp protein [Salipiger sp. P9]|uniref:circularly permuted type 2 ATP-grasp protein n=1 Tax=Salipiger pentaromativorans TaxID=2943193 RepID=UPI002158080E|nr:circularly permuted type 2 ATP-grasp protein [Salipiger pentaromativorans]MCR8550333.1 circularly permuted type 2 ATP-grasp protein [Salipiger pentaromativorans]